ncbi:helix-turn-helix domain-containing protein [Siphonobacter sp. SORGH_AS_0500]|uniref:helix-turn-helix domain-containing protein n=1 Tax=Siphonobacter sp. SORGH_AS_0500 TaxID=1864824 RepID=UPI00285EF105|nr:helix-turn-helix domain-containing protein [Siphonobacter sp. SORGH_AS_0500]MDR6194937.1 hypothetical protein [Siphonobacter sp. SORGH_AS_0500]
MQELRILSIPEAQFNLLIDKVEEVKRGQTKLITEANSDFLYTEEEATQIFKCSKKTLQNWRARGYIDFIQLGSVIRYPKGAILAFTERFKVKSNFTEGGFR